MNRFEINSVLQYLHNLLDLDEGEEVQVTFKANNIVSIGEDGIFRALTPSSDGPLDALVDTVHEDMCMDCLTNPRDAQDIFFRNGAKAYIEYLMLKYGPYVPISREMAEFYFKNDFMTKYVLYLKHGQENMLRIKDMEQLKIWTSEGDHLFISFIGSINDPV